MEIGINCFGMNKEDLKKYIMWLVYFENIKQMLFKKENI